MEVFKLINSLKIKTKLVNFLIDPDSDLKNGLDFDFYVLLSKTLLFTNEKPVLKGGGDYEIKSIKISAFEKDGLVSYLIRIEGMDILFLDAEAINCKELIKECDVVIIKTKIKSKIDEQNLASFNTNMIILWGEYEESQIASNVKKIAKISISKDKLPQELEVNLIV